MVKINTKLNKYEAIDYIYSNFKIDNWYDSNDGEYTYNYIVYIKNRYTKEVMKIKYGCNKGHKYGNIKLLDIIMCIIIDIDLLNNGIIDDNYMDNPYECKRVKRIIRREERHLQNILDIPVNTFIDMMEDLRNDY